MCGIAAFVEVARGAGRPALPLAGARADVEAVCLAGVDAALARGLTEESRAAYAGGDERIARLAEWARGLKRTGVFAGLSLDDAVRDEAAGLAARLRAFADAEDARLQTAPLAEADLELFSARALRVRDVAWHVVEEALSSVAETRALCGDAPPVPKLLEQLRKVVAVLRCVDRIEIRGRDSAGLAVQVAFDDAAACRAFLASVASAGLSAELTRRSSLADLPPLSVSVNEGGPGLRPTATFVYKVAAEVGRLGDNVAGLRGQIRGDRLLLAALATPGSRALILGHTRWASSGVISIPNCHPIDNGAYPAAAATDGPPAHRAGRFWVVLNGDVDNHVELRSAYEAATGRRVSPRITTDTKVIALEIERHVVAGLTVDEAFRRASAAFLGSCAIGMITDLAPGRLFLSLRGSGQSLYVGVSEDGFFGASEVYGLVEETALYVKLDGEKERVPGDPATRGEIAIVSDEGPRGAPGVDRRGFDGTRLAVAAKDVRTAEITTRDVDRGDYEHFFRKEITQSSRSVRRTLWGRVLTGPDGRRRLAPHVLSEKVRSEIESGHMNRVYLVGQGTAAVAGTGIADYLRMLLPSSALRIHALPATEMSGFHLDDDMSRTLVIAVTQSGSSADTNRAVDLARQRGAHVVAVVNRRNSDITYRADGVVYTSDGRDVEMSVASTKAFYSQLVAGALLALAIARALGRLDDARMDVLLGELTALPDLMQRVLDDESSIAAAAELAPTRSQWAVVASGPNRVAAAEARIKLSELCYKSIALDTVENKKHIDLSTEPLVMVLAAGNPETVLNDVVKDVAIFKAHKALPIVFATEGEKRFEPYASAVVHLPKAPQFSSVCLLALASHLFGYHAARSIDENARFLAGIRASLVAALGDDAARRALPQTLASPRREYLDRLQRERFTSAMLPVTAVRLSTLLDIATGVSLTTPEAEALLGADGGDVVPVFVNVLGEALDQCTRPVDAIKHQAKIVTVGTSRPQDTLTGPVADALNSSGVVQESLLPVDLLELSRVQPAIAAIEGLTRYSITGLRPDGTIAPETQIRVVERRGTAAAMRSRVDAGGPLAGTKRQVVAARRLFLGVGGGDNRRIAILPLLGGDRHVAGLALLHLKFADTLPRDEKLRVLGPKLDRLRDLVAESNRAFDPAMLDALTPAEVVLEDADGLARRVLAAAQPRA